MRDIEILTNPEASQPSRHWSFLRLAEFAGNRKKDRLAILDVACGFGENPALMRALGAHVHAFDISPRLMRDCLSRMRTENLLHDIKVIEARGYKRSENILIPKLWIGDAVKAINYISGPYTAVSCTGNSLGYFSDAERSLRLMMSAISDGGRVFLEIENKTNPRLIAEALASKKVSAFNSAERLRLIWEFLTAGKIEIKKVFKLESGAQHKVSVQLLSVDLISRIAYEEGCRILEVRGNDWLRNTVTKKFTGKALIERLLGRFSPFNRLASSLWIEIVRK
jgi:SAM-dependent methyltransferase